MLQSQPGLVLFSDTARGGGLGTEDQTGLGTPGEGLLHDTFKPPGGVRPYHRMVGRVSSLPRLSESYQPALIVTSRHSLKIEVHRHSRCLSRQRQTSGTPGAWRGSRVAACDSSEPYRLTSVGFLLSGVSWRSMDPRDESRKEDCRHSQNFLQRTHLPRSDRAHNSGLGGY